MTARQWLRLMLVGLGASVVPLDTAVNIAFPDITRSFGLPIQMIQWVVICYVLTYASLMLAFGRVGDIFGHARVFRAGLLWSVAAFLLCAAAPAYGWLLFFRFLQGIGAGLVISVAPALVTGLYPEHRRSRAVAAFTMMFAIASAAGPLIGGTLVHYWGWAASISGFVRRSHWPHWCSSGDCRKVRDRACASRSILIGAILLAVGDQHLSARAQRDSKVWPARLSRGSPDRA